MYYGCVCMAISGIDFVGKSPDGSHDESMS